MSLSLGLSVLLGTLQVDWPLIAKARQNLGTSGCCSPHSVPRPMPPTRSFWKPSSVASSARLALGAAGADLSQVWALPLRVLSWWESHTGAPKQEWEVHVASGVRSWGPWGRQGETSGKPLGEPAPEQVRKRRKVCRRRGTASVKAIQRLKVGGQMLLAGVRLEMQQSPSTSPARRRHLDMILGL